MIQNWFVIYEPEEVVIPKPKRTIKEKAIVIPNKTDAKTVMMCNI